MATFRTVTGGPYNLPNGVPWAGGKLKIKLLESSFVGVIQFPVYELIIILSSEGTIKGIDGTADQAGIQLWCEDEGFITTKYRCTLPDRKYFDFDLAIGDGTPIDLSILRALGNSPATPVDPLYITVAELINDALGTITALDADLLDFAAIDPTDGDLLQRVGDHWVNKTPAEIKDSLAFSKDDLGLDAVDNTADDDKPVSIAQGIAIDAVSDAIIAHANDHNNPHGVTKAQIGLGNADNTADIDKPISTAQATALDNLADGIDAVAATVVSHVGNTNNPHGVTKAQVGLGNSDNTSDVNKPVSTAQAAAIGVVADALTAHATDHTNPHAVTKAQVGLGNADNTSDANKPVSTAQQAALDAKATTAALTAHTTDVTNPHAVTKAQVGLGNVDNVSDVNKPVSTAQAAAIGAKADTTALTAHTTDTNNPHAVTKTQVGLGNVDNTSDANKPVSTAQQTALNLKADSSTLTAHTTNTSNPHAVTKAQVGLGNADNTSDVNKPISTAQQTAFDAKISLLTVGWTTGQGAGTTLYMTPGVNVGGSGTEIQRQIAVPAGKLSNLRVHVGGAQPSTGTLVITIRVNGAATAITVTVPASTVADTTIVDTTHSVSVNANDRVSIEIVNNASATGAAHVMISLGFS